MDSQHQEKLFKKSKALSQTIFLYVPGSFVMANLAACILQRDGGVRKKRDLDHSVV